MLDPRKPIVLISTAPWMPDIAGEVIDPHRREVLKHLKTSVRMVRKYVDQRGRMRVAPGMQD